MGRLWKGLRVCWGWASWTPGLTKNLISVLASQAGASSVLSQGVDPRNTFYVLNPHSNLSSTEERFRASFSRSGDEGIT